MKKYELPEWEDIKEKESKEEDLDPIEEFIYEFERDGLYSRLFRNLLMKALEYYHKESDKR